MHIFHKWKPVGKRRAYRWLGGVIDGILVYADVEAKECTVCGKVKQA